MNSQNFLSQLCSNSRSSIPTVTAVPIQPFEYTPCLASLPSLPQSPTTSNLRFMPGEFHFFQNIDPLRPPPRSQISHSSFTSSSSSLDELPTFPKKKRAWDSEDSSRKGHHKRLIRNRESAARSRARQQAYKKGLELQIDTLKKEIAILRQEQHDQKLLLRRTTRFPEKRTLYRASTAPF